MLSKDALRREFSADYKRYYSTELFERENLHRRACRECGKFFWSADESRELCGDSDHEPYSFIKGSPERVDYVDFWRVFSRFFKENGHAEISRYPVVSRWRQDLYFTIASIQDFQRIEGGKMSFEYKQNPLVVPQICLRFNDVPNVGITGRHLTSFMMAGQHSFSYPKEGYWRDETIRMNYEFLTRHVGVRKDGLTYTEDVWAMGDFSEFGPCIEAFSGGLELVNNVFTEFEMVDGERRELHEKVVDVGWGFERLLWYKSGAQTVYDAVFPNEVGHIYKSSGIKPDHELYRKVASVSGGVDVTEYRKRGSAEAEIIRLSGIDERTYNSVIRPHQAVYAIADHTRTLLFAISDGALPSNVGGGYNLRILLRRVFDFMERYGIDIDILKLMELHAHDMRGLYPELGESIDGIKDVVEVERERYANTKRSSRKIVESLIGKGHKRIDVDTAKRLYESNGVTPEFIEEVSKEMRMEVEIDDEAYSKIIKGDFADRKRAERPGFDTSGLRATERLYYRFAESSTSRVVRSFGDAVALDRTPFYPEGGGQEADHGTIGDAKVVGARLIDGVVVHMLDGKHNLEEGSEVECRVDLDRRERIMAHHTATHLISASARMVLGKHAWQEGAGKGAGKAHIDIAHYEPLSEKDVADIERMANEFILKGIRVEMLEMDRGDAEAEFGFSIYQGHGVPAARLRIVKISDKSGKLIDAEACGGLHLMGREHLIGIIKIIDSARIHDGVDRLEYVAGRSCLDYISSMERRINSISKSAGIDVDKIEKGVPQMIRELDMYRKRYTEALEHLSGFAADDILRESRSKHIIKNMNYNRLMLRNIATHIVNSDDSAVAMLYNEEMELVCIAGKNAKISAAEFVRTNTDKIAMGLEFKGGGTDRIAEGVLIVKNK